MENPNAWLAERVNAAIPHGGQWTPSSVADALVERLEAEEPDAFAEWLRWKARDFVRQVIVERHRADRARILAQNGARVFAQAADSDNDDALDPYLMPITLDDATGVRMMLGDMTGADCRTAAQGYHRRVNENAMKAALLEAVAKRARKRKVRDALSREQLATVIASVGIGEVEAA